MLALFFFILGLVNNIFLILLFLVQKNRVDLDELWICSNALKDLFSVGNSCVMPFYCPCNYKLKESSQIEQNKHFFCGIGVGDFLMNTVE